MKINHSFIGHWFFFIIITTILEEKNRDLWYECSVTVPINVYRYPSSSFDVPRLVIGWWVVNTPPFPREEKLFQTVYLPLKVIKEGSGMECSLSKQESWLHFNGQSFYICSTCEATQNFHCLMCLHLQRFGFLLQSIMNYLLIVYYYHFGTSFS